jgi:hypothetical protein
MSKSDKPNNTGAAASRLRSAQKVLDSERRFIDDSVQVEIRLLRQSRGLPLALADLFSPEAADAVESKGENEAIFFTKSHIEGRKLGGRGATIPRVSESYR